MRTKKLLLMAAVGMVATATSFAQIYSVNAVGYVNETVPADGVKLALLANPLNNGDNTLNTVLPLTDDIDASVYLWREDPPGFIPCTWYGTENGWFPNASVPPGLGFFIRALAPGGTLNLTFVGEVPQGQLVNNLPVPPRMGLRGSIVPQAGTLDDLAFPGEEGDVVYTFSVATQRYVPIIHYGADGWWPNNVIGVAQGFWVKKDLGNTRLTWTRNFSVNP